MDIPEKTERDISPNEFRQFLQRARREILDLRSQVTNLAPKADAYDKLSTVIELLPKRSMPMGEDLVWNIDKRLKELEPKDSPQ